MSDPRPKRRPPHVIARITYEPKTNDGPCECSCGWVGRAVDFARHRAEMGIRNAGSGNGYPTRNQWSYEPVEAERWASR